MSEPTISSATRAPQPTATRPPAAPPRAGGEQPAVEDRYTPSDSGPRVPNRQDLARAVHGDRGGEVCEAAPETADSPSYTNDPSLDHNNRTCDPNLHEHGAYDANGRWDGARILRNLGQLDTTGQPGNQGNRCAAAAPLGGAILAGPQATARVTERLASHITDEGTQRELYGIRQRVLDGSATNGDLNRLQEVAYNRYNTDGSNGLNGAERAALNQDLAARVQTDAPGRTATALGARNAGANETEEQFGRTLERMSDLRNGQSFGMSVDTNNDGVTNHAVQVGRDQDGRLYVYDPLARQNQPNLIYHDENANAFNHYTTGVAGRATSNTGIPGRVNVIRGGTVEY